MQGTVLVISPHLDDAVLSLGGSIAAWTSMGTRVVVCSVYTTGPALEQLAPSMRRFADYTTRRAEDDAACGVVGAEVRRLDQVERAFRPPFLTGWSFFTTPDDRAGFSTLARVTAALDALVSLAPDHILVPLGIGNHIDHVEAMLAACDWAAAHGWLDRLRFYEDFYALAGTMRRKHFVSALHAWPRWQSPTLRARRLGVVLRTIALARRGPPIETYLDPLLRHARWAAATADIQHTEQRKLAAVKCYASQTRAFGGYAGIVRALRAYHAWWGRAEPLWRPDL
ncbi:MAG: PIG-L family deacetylase [Kofleriaceae bacterium]|nr:PIG-L family deacetylase [Kofleriaceae bacterium]